MSEEVGAGLPLWHPKGATIGGCWRNTFSISSARPDTSTSIRPTWPRWISTFGRDTGRIYHEDMFPPMDLDTERMVLRPMNPRTTFSSTSRSRAAIASCRRAWRSWGRCTAGSGRGLERIEPGALHDAERRAHLLHPGSDQGRVLEGDEAGGAGVSRIWGSRNTAIACRCATPPTRRSTLTTTPCGSWASRCCAMR